MEELNNNQETKEDINIEEQKKVGKTTKLSNSRNKTKEVEQKENNIKEEKIPEVKDATEKTAEIKEVPDSTPEKIVKEDSHNKNTSHKKIIILSTVIICVILILMVLSTGFAILNINNKSIMQGVSISEIDMKGLNKEQAIQKLTDVFTQNIEKEITIKSGDFEYSIDGSKIEAKYDIDKAVDEAYNIGRKGNIFVNNFDILKTAILKKKINAELTYNNDLLDATLSDISTKVPDAIIQPSYYIDGNELIITKGKSGNTIDMKSTKNAILNKIKNNDGNPIELNLIKADPQAIDIDRIHSEVYKEPQDAYYVKDPFQVFPHVDGVDFDVDAAKQLLQEDKQEYTIDLIITVPKITTDQIGTEAFPNLLSSFSTKYDAGKADRSTNLKLAASKINGKVIMPGETFSYNQTLGERTIAEGYREALGYAEGKVENTLGGGICQISSTLYDAAVYANLDIVERHNHMFLTSYTTAGKDATVVYGALDFKFKNTRKYPVMIKASVSNGIAKIDIYGVKEDVEYEVEISTTVLNYVPYKVTYEDTTALPAGKQIVIQNGMNGCNSITYRILKLNGQQVSSTVLSRDTYDPMNKIIQRGVAAALPSVPLESNPEPTQPEPENPIPPTVEGPEDTTNETTEPVTE